MSDADARTGPASPGPPSLPGLGALLDEAIRFWDQAAGSSRRAADGTYTPTDAMAQLDEWVSASAACALRLVDALLGGRPTDEPDGPEPTDPTDPKPDPGRWTATMTVLPSVLQRPLTLRTSGLRAIGLGGVTQIPPSDVTFVPDVLPAGVDTFEVTVSFANTPGPATRIFEGDIEAVETNATVTDRIRPNNRDGGPVR